ncbi:Hercynylcysteine sulfoxide lyase [Yarrowia sp. C11]|nr:Hercynylcysteine sulfoxide lyase [Yarrowia sp. E02]KAG5371933.1 Hercynylcysteine sulfoxide lyase [Yarrowia sp. C11]
MTTSFGHTTRHKCWDFDSQNTPLNHGSFGATPKEVEEHRFDLIRQIERNSDKFMRVDLYKMEEETRDLVSKWINSEKLNTVFVPNASVGFNTVIRSLPLKEGDVIVHCSTLYGACDKTLKFMENRYGVKSAKVDIRYPEDSDEDVVEKYRKVIEANPRTKMVIFDTVSSMPGCLLPFNELIQLCKELNVLSFVDGAHGVGLVELDLKKNEPDFFVSNLHKWGYVPRGAAVLVVAKKHHKTIHTLPVSHTYLDDGFESVSEQDKNRRLVDRFTFVGTIDFSTHLSTPAAVKFRESLGGEEVIRKYCFELARKVGAFAAEFFTTEVLENAAGTLTTAMVNVRLPVSEKWLKEASNEQKDELFKVLNNYPLENFDTFVPPVFHNDKVYIRLSCQVYNELSDYKVGVQAVKEALKQIPGVLDE